jgi:hypothetical protein
MHYRVRSSVISRFAGVMMTVWLCGIGPAWAGGGGSDGGASFQMFLQQVCGLVGATSCFTVPTLTQIILGISDYENAPPDFVRGPLGNFAGICSVSTTGTGGLPICSENNAVSTVNPRAPSSITLSDLPNLTPLAFQAVSGQPATPVALDSPDANSFVYMVLTGADGHHTLDVVFDYVPWTNNNQPASSFTFPVVILNANNSVATLNLTANCNGATGCTVTGVGTKPLTAAQLGIGFRYQLAPSPNSSTPHATSTFQLPVFVTLKTDPVYFGVDNSGVPTFINQFSGAPTAFSLDDVGFTPNSGVLRNGGKSIGISPYPAPLCPASGCPTPPAPTFYGFCATIAGTPAAATFASIGTDGTTYASSPVLPPLPKCPSM